MQGQSVGTVGPQSDLKSYGQNFLRNKAIARILGYTSWHLARAGGELGQAGTVEWTEV